MLSDTRYKPVSRRAFFRLAASLVGGFYVAGARSHDKRIQSISTTADRAPAEGGPPDTTTLFLSGDVMLGRGIDQILPVASPPRLYEPFLTDARQYIDLAEDVNGPIPRPVDHAYVWGDALAELAAFAPDARIINLETAISTQGKPWRGKHIHYRFHPANVRVLQVAGVDCCVLANNHVLDWGYVGLRDTLLALDEAGIRYAGAGRDSEAAGAPAQVPVGTDRRVRVLGLASPTSGVPPAWAAGRDLPGVNLMGHDVQRIVQAVVDRLGQKRDGDIVVASVHWGGNWGYAVPPFQRELAHALVDTGMVDVVHGHSSHHPKAIEVYQDRLILYGCGDLLNDYEGIRGHEEYRSELSLMYFPTFDAVSGRLLRLSLTPMRIKRFSLHRADERDAQWLRDSLNGQGGPFGSHFGLDQRGRLVLA